MIPTDPMEAIVAKGLQSAGIRFVTDQEGNPTHLDFGLENGIQIEVKRYHSERSNDQLKRAPDVILVQGEKAVRWFAEMLAKGG